MPAGSLMRNTPSTTTAADTLHRQPLLPSANSKATHIRNKDGTKLITVPSRKVSNPDSTSLSTSSTSSSISNNIISDSTAAARTYAAHLAPVALLSASMDYPHNAGSNHLGGKKKKKKKGKQQAQQQAPTTSQTNSHNHIHDHDHDHDHHHHHHHDGYYDEPHLYNRTHSPTSPRRRAGQYQQDIKASMPDYGEDHPPELVDPEDDELYYSGPAYDEDDEDSYTPPTQTAPAPLAGKKKNKKKKKKGVSNGQELYQNSVVASPGNHGVSKKKDRIWNTSTIEERERIKDFWLSLGEEERRSLVKVEKEAVLRKMKEQQKHSCSCIVCGRKRTAIEEELEVLYDAYYEELEQYAHQQQSTKYAAQSHSPSPGAYSAARIPPPPPPPPPPPGPPPGHHAHHQGHRVEEIDDDGIDDDDEDDDEDDDDDDLLGGPLPENDSRPDFFNFGNSLTVKGGILTVADDLLKNDGKKFIEMMEQLAERRMQREEEANAGHPSLVGQNHIGHTHSQSTDYEDEEYGDDDDDEDEEDGFDDEDEDEPDAMTEEQRMEEGRRMFQIFAARMFEQRVLTAYREKVARERQDKLLEELDEEDQLRAQREEKKAKEKEKKKERKRLQKLAKEEERLKREAEKAEEEAKQRAIEEKKAEEVRRRKEEQRMKREAEKKAIDEERRRKEEEKKKRLEEEREREAEKERKRKEHHERERKKREEAAKRAKEEKEFRERERREREERERKEHEDQARKEAGERERIKKEDEAKAKAEAAAAAAAAATTVTKRIPASIQTSIPPQPHGIYNSPHLSVATPAIPKQPVGYSPNRTRNASQQGSMQGSVVSSPKTPQAVPRIGSSASPSTPVLQQNTLGPIIVPTKQFHFIPHMPTSPLPHHIAPPPGVLPPDNNGFPMMNHMGMNGPSPIQPFLSGMPPRPFGNGLPMYQPTQIPMGSSPQYRGFAAQNVMPMPAPGMRPMPPQGRGMFMSDLAPGMHQLPPGVPLMPPGSTFMTNRVEPVPIPGVHPHARALSGSFEPVQRPTPIQRPSSIVPVRDPEGGHRTIDELSKVMGSRALLEDDEEEEPLLENQSPNRRSSSGLGFSPRPSRGLPAASPLFMDPMSHIFQGPSWSNPAPLGTMSNSLPTAWSTGAGWSETDAARSTFNRRRVGKLDHVRILAAHKCRELGGENSNFIEVSTLQRAVEQAAPPELSITIKELTDILDVEGDPLNGGGNFFVTHDTNGRTLVRYEEDEVRSIDGVGNGLYQAPGAPIGPSNHITYPGEIGSPTSGGFSHPFKPAVGPPPGIAANGLPSPGF